MKKHIIISLISAISAISQLAFTDVLGSWKFEDDSSGQLVATDVGTLNLVLGTSSTAFRDPQFDSNGYSGQCMHFLDEDAVGFNFNDVLSGAQALISDTYLIEAYVSPDVLLEEGAYGTLVSLSDSTSTGARYDIRLAGTASGTYLQCRYTDASATEHIYTYEGYSFSVDTWAYISVAYDNTAETLTLKVDDSSQTFISVATPVSPSSPRFELGALYDNNGWSDFFVGKLDEVSISDAIPEPTTLSLFSISSAFILLMRHTRS